MPGNLEKSEKCDDSDELVAFKKIRRFDLVSPTTPLKPDNSNKHALCNPMEMQEAAVEHMIDPMDAGV